MPLPCARRSSRRTPQVLALVVSLCTGLTSGACAARAAASSPSAPVVAQAQAISDEGLKAFVAKVRELAAEGRPPRNDTAQTVETWDGVLAASLAELERAPTGAHHRAVALEYARLGVRDTAHEHYTKALTMDRRDVAAYDGRARLWRDFGFPGYGLGDAHRAVYLAPSSAEAVNTLGTIFEALGDFEKAREHYQHAAALKPSATWPLINLCHVDTLLARRDALVNCSKAVEAAPASRVAHNNLALAYAAAGSFERAREEFKAANDPATAAYNLGIVFMAASRLPEATDAFRDAWRLDPHLTAAVDRLRQLEALTGR